MPRAKAHIKNLLDQYIETQNKISKLEAAIAEVSCSQSVSVYPEIDIPASKGYLWLRFKKSPQGRRQ